MMRRHPSVKWAQRSDKVFITIELPDAENVKLKLQPEGRLYFSATSGPDSTEYEVDLELYDKVNVEESKAAVGLRNICYLVKKAENRWWSRLVKQGGKPPIFLKVDWDKWIDEDEETENRDLGMGGIDDMDFSKLAMGGDDDMDAGSDEVNWDPAGAEVEGTANTSGSGKSEESEAKV